MRKNQQENWSEVTNEETVKPEVYDNTIKVK